MSLNLLIVGGNIMRNIIRYLEPVTQIIKKHFVVNAHKELHKYLGLKQIYLFGLSTIKSLYLYIQWPENNFKDIETSSIDRNPNQLKAELSQLCGFWILSISVGEPIPFFIGFRLLAPPPQKKACSRLLGAGFRGFLPASAPTPTK